MMLETVRQFSTLQGGLTKRGTPSGSPMLMTVCSCFEREEPNNCQNSADIPVRILNCVSRQLPPEHLGPFSCLESTMNEKTTMNILSKLGLRSCPYFGLEEAGVEDCCGCSGVRGEIE